MKKLQEVFNRIQESKKEQKELKSMVKDALTNSKQYQSILQEMSELKAKKKNIEDAINEEFSSEINKIEILKSEIENDSMIMSDMALNQLIKGESVKVVDSKGKEYETQFKVNFKKN